MKLTELLSKITPLPWKIDEPNPVKVSDAIYCTHAANVLPELVKQARIICDKVPHDGYAIADWIALQKALARAENVETKQ